MHVSRYNLEYCLPLFLWAADCSRKTVHPFWELLEIISKADSSTLFGLDTETEVTLQILLQFNPFLIYRNQKLANRWLSRCHVFSVARSLKEQEA